MRRGNWLSGFALSISIGWGCTAVALCSIAALAFSNLAPLSTPGARAVSTPVLVPATGMIKDGRQEAKEDRGVVYELDGDYYHIDSGVGTGEAPSDPVEATPPVRPRKKEGPSPSSSRQKSVYVAEDSVGFLAVVVSPAGDVQVYRQADESFVSD